MSLHDKLVLILSVFDIVHLASWFPVDQGAEADSVLNQVVSGFFLVV